ncbi:MAG: hypothetical protein KBF21_02375 [Thermoanaerobaculia bacterium]|nr:hypothetical protein [Thermoanaerobaculia bacterium]
MTRRGIQTLLCALGLLTPAAVAAQPAPAAGAAQSPAAATREASRAPLRTVPWPNLAGLEPAVRQALQRASTTLATGTSDGEAHGELGRLFHAHGFPAAAQVCYANAADLQPDDFRWPHLRGLALIEEQRLEEAGDAFAEAFSRRPYYPALLRQARVAQELGDFAQTKALLAVALAHSPNDPALLALLGEQAALEGDDRAAVDLLSRALAFAPGATRLHYPLALSYRALGDVAAADRHLALAGRVGIVPLDPLADEVRARRVGATAWDLEGQRALQAGDAAAAAKAFRKALEARPDDPELRNRLRASEAAIPGEKR